MITAGRILLALGLLATSFSAALAGPKAVVELFTSEGCSSCPPADAFLAELADREDVLALAYHVDYWDYLGWKDTLGRPENTERQREYARVRGDSRVFTPQMIVNGSRSFVGSHRGEVSGAIAGSELPIPVEMRNAPDSTIEIRVGANPTTTRRRTTIRFILYKRQAQVAIQRGENAGKLIDYRNVVTSIRPIGMWKGPAVTVSLPAREVMSGEADGCAVIVQEDTGSGPGAILGAAELDWPQS